MAIPTMSPLASLFLAFMVALCSASVEKQTYVVYMGDAPRAFTPNMHHDVLASVTGSHEIAKASMVHSYSRSFNAFAAKLSPEEAIKLAGTERVVSVFPNTRRNLHTTNSWDFVGFPMKVRRNIKIERDVIIGMVDTGITPTSRSFRDDHLGPPPARWTGHCEKSKAFSGCNNKLIGAKYYRLDGSMPMEPEILSTIDVIGHGTHTASTAAGKPVRRANFYGMANGTARGAVPGARLAAYKVCWDDAGCRDVDILAAFDDAIADGVDVISVSIGGPPSYYFSDAIAIGAFHAMKKGVITVMSAGNNGPTPGTTENVAPWMFTVGASSTGRHFKTKVSLGNGNVIIGTSINTFAPSKQYDPLISGLQAVNKSYYPWLQPIRVLSAVAHTNTGRSGTVLTGKLFTCSACDPGTLDANKVKGKIVFCIPDYGATDSTVKDLGAAGLIAQYDYGQDTAFTFALPAVQLDADKSYMVYSYINSTNSPRAIIHRTYAINATVARIASFSSRGPNPVSRKIFKPDIVAPGVDILAAYTRLSSVTGMQNDDRFVNYNMMSGTSMSCPHVSGAAAYVKSFHPHWSPAAIKSALMTTAKAMIPRLKDRAEFSYGAGLLNPRRAVNPGLVYDMNEVSYIQFLCKEGFNASQLKLITSGQFSNCSAVPLALDYDGINYPAMQVYVKNSLDPINAVFHRTVTNVGPVKSVYRARVRAPTGINVTVSPQTLSFAGANQRCSFKVRVIGEHLGTKPMVSGSLVWVGVRHKVRSPIVAYQFIATG